MSKEKCRQVIKIACPYQKGACIEGRIEHHSAQGQSAEWIKLQVVEILQDGRMVLSSDDPRCEFRSKIVPYKEGWFRPYCDTN